MPLQIATPEGQRDMTPQEEAAFIASNVPTAAQIKAQGSAAIQTLLDTTALSFGYDTLERMTGYRGSAVVLWNAQAVRAFDWRDACWSKAAQIQTDATAGNWPTAGAGQTPTVADVIAAMPAANIPTV